jgi:hypothetical protein
MAERHRKASPGRYGVHPCFVGVRQSAALTANATAVFTFPKPRRKAYVETLSISTSTLPVDADGTFVVSVAVYRADALVATLASAFDIEATVTTKDTLVAIPFDAATTEIQRTLLPADVLKVFVVNNSAAIDTQPVDMVFHAELLCLE